MKQLILLSTLFLLFSCSGDDSSSTNNQNPVSNSCINPPTWLQGTWDKYYEYEPDVLQDRYVITEDNIISGKPDVHTINWKSTKCLESTYIITDEQYGNNYYLFKTTITSGGNSAVINSYFIKESNNTIRYSNWLDNEAGIIYHKQ